MQFVDSKVLDPRRNAQPRSEFVGPEFFSRNQLRIRPRWRRFECFANHIRVDHNAAAHRAIQCLCCAWPRGLARIDRALSHLTARKDVSLKDGIVLPVLDPIHVWRAHELITVSGRRAFPDAIWRTRKRDDRHRRIDAVAGVCDVAATCAEHDVDCARVRGPYGKREARRATRRYSLVGAEPPTMREEKTFCLGSAAW